MLVKARHGVFKSPPDTGPLEYQIRPWSRCAFPFFCLSRSLADADTHTHSTVVLSLSLSLSLRLACAAHGGCEAASRSSSCPGGKGRWRPAPGSGARTALRPTTRPTDRRGLQARRPSHWGRLLLPMQCSAVHARISVAIHACMYVCGGREAVNIGGCVA
jgi:hypothetical protein